MFRLFILDVLLLSVKKLIVWRIANFHISIVTVKLRKETSAHSSAQAWEPDNVHNRSAIGPVSGSGQVRGGLEYQVLAINSSACTNTSSHYTYYTLSSCIFYFLVSNLFGRKYFIFLCNWELVLI